MGKKRRQKQNVRRHRRKGSSHVVQYSSGMPKKIGYAKFNEPLCD